MNFAVKNYSHFVVNNTELMVSDWMKLFDRFVFSFIGNKNMHLNIRWKHNCFILYELHQFQVTPVWDDNVDITSRLYYHCM